MRFLGTNMSPSALAADTEQSDRDFLAMRQARARFRAENPSWSRREVNQAARDFVFPPLFNS